ncbi:ABC transporter permease [Streptomyces sp. DG2A-72]|uniref:ABC transporter permease n=1 Tax=Streptomyces sp. DG2A-72 TaxID=3051386 RepID=UPI00265BEFC4|nr:ABC transporter permease [Streptomyces sp. DG2A-72]MDO0933859.1 ABC transporter permease [Streptomyces sp. DG2A-72]
MLTTTLHALRTRWTTFAGSFVALSLGVALMTVMGLTLASSLDAPGQPPERFAAAPVVVQGQDTLRVGDRTQKLAQPRPVPAQTVAALRTLGKVTEDCAFAVRAERAPGDLVGHPWSTAAFAPYELSAGRAPRAADEVVATDDWTAVGQKLRTDHGTVRVVGTVRARGFEDALFYPDARAAALSPPVMRLVVDAQASEVRRLVAPGVRVLTGDERRLADADPDRDAEALTALNALFGTAGGVTAFVSVFVVASTFAFAVAQRRREFGLLRMVGATPGRLRRMVVAEALTVGALASTAGCVLGAYGAPHLAGLVVDGGLAPAWFTIGDHSWPYHLAFWTGLSAALCGSVAASWRAGRTGPTQALREASVDSGASGMRPWGRLLCGTALLVTAAVTLVLALLTEPGDLLHRKTYISRPMLLITAVALLSPVLVGPLTRLIVRLPGAIGLLVRENAAAGVGRTAAVAAPVLVTVALTGSLLGATATLNEARATEAREQTAADFVVTSRVGSGVESGMTPLDAATVRRLREVPGAEVSPVASSAVYVLEDGVALIKSEAHAVDPHRLAATARLPLTDGRVTDLDDDSIIVNEEWSRHRVGEHVTVWLGDGTRRSLRIAGVMPVGTGDNGVYITAANAPGAVVERVDVRVREGADRAGVVRALRQAVGLREAVGGRGHAAHADVVTSDKWLRTAFPTTGFADTDRTTRLGILLVLGIALLYTGISLANTQIMAASDRARELTALRLAGATRTQVLRLVAAEALTVVVIGALLGLLVTVLNLLGMWGALTLQSVWSPIRLPWAELGAATGACALLAVASAVLPTAVALRLRT